MNNRNKNIIIGSILIIVGILFIVFGIFYYDFFREFLCVIIGIGMIVFNVPAVILSLYNLGFDKKRNLMFLSGIIGVGLGVFYIPFHGTVMSIICGAFLLILPTIRIIFEEKHFEQFKKEIILYMIGFFLTLNMLDVMFKVIVITSGIVLIVLGLVFIGTSFNNKRSKKKGSINASIEVRDVDILQIEHKDE